MRTYTLLFKAEGKQIVIPINCDVIYGFTSLSYKPIVDESISQWLKENNNLGKSIIINDIILLNESKQIVFNQESRNNIKSIEIKDFNEDSNTDIKGVKKLSTDKYI